MNKFIRINFASGHTFEIPVAAIAEDRASYQALCEPDRTAEQHAAETAMLFADNIEAAFGWLRCSMNWAAVEKHAKLVEFKPFDFREAFLDAELQAVGEATRPDLMALGERAIDAPIELAISQAAAENRNCLLFGMHGDGKAEITIAAAAIVGPADVVHAYLAAFDQFDRFMRSRELLVAPAASAAVN